MQERMMLVLRISSTLALVLACALLVASGVRWCTGGPETARRRRIPAGSEKLVQAGGESGLFQTASPLIAQAEAFAAHLAGPGNPEEQPASEPNDVPLPAAASPTGLKLHATSYYPDQPGRSMALISDISAPLEDQRWVKEDAQVGGFIIHEIRPSMIVYREGDHLREAAVDHNVGLPSIVRDPRSGSHRVGRAPQGEPVGAWYAPHGVPSDPNRVELGSR
jgi:hypothetical protein